MKLALRLLAFPLTITIVLVGVWVAGGLVTNDFTVAMWLAAGWMALAGLVALGIAVASRSFRLPVLGAYVLTAAALGVYLGMSVFLDDVVNEKVATVAAPRENSSGAEPAEPMNVLLRSGRLDPVRHAARGDAKAIELAQGGRVLTLTEFEVDNGPDLRLYLVAGPATTEGEVDDFVDLGGLKGNKGNQQYELPGGLDLERYSTVVVWCRAFSVLFARAPLRA
jgi:electron transfer DM13